jgi:hypothetical protein
VRSAAGTSSGCSVCYVGDVSAWPVPTAKTSASSTQGDEPGECQNAERRCGDQHEALGDEQEMPAIYQVANGASCHREKNHWQAGRGLDQRDVGRGSRQAPV